ncbi:hypothetical protein COV16_03615 [Candidatus Woesearchaeota archaeon CG10_big_fil_rev_8_21_14_0_10_34_8]|nr:MAG: hypothetical protein COV16_03615 [Candidatus Woesearchaeota archaeon CG10_big_fil_rev_8_21_14_0_10_34_8]
MNKKANVQSFLIGLIILLVVAFVFLMFYQKTIEISEAHKTIDICRQNIEVNAIGNIAGMQLYDDVKCPTEYYEVDSFDEEDIKREISDATAACWYKMGEGKYELFDTNVEKDVYCVICSVIEFDSAPQEVTGMLKYMRDNNAPALYTKGQTKSYLDFLTPYDSDTDWSILDEFDEGDTNNKVNFDTINTGYDYAQIFIYEKKGHLHKVWTATAGLIAGTVGGALIISGVGAPVGVVLVGGAVVGAGGAAAGYAAGSDTASDWEAYPAYVPYTEETLNALPCEKLPVEQ